MPTALELLQSGPALRRTPQLRPEEEESLLRSLGRGALSGIAAAGNFLDLPGSAFRDILAGQNPLDQFLSPFSPENRTTGRQLMEQAGILSPNRPGLDAGDVAGFGTEVLLDPLTYFTFGASALGKAGKAARMTGLLDDAAKTATKKFGRQMGKRQARINLTIDDLIGGLPDKAAKKKAVKNLERAAEKMGTTLQDLRGEKLGGMFGVGMPFRDPFATLPVGRNSERLARGMDVAGEAIRYGKYSPVRPIAGMIGRGLKGAGTARGQKIAKSNTARTEVRLGEAREQLAGLMGTFEESGLFDLDKVSSRVAAKAGRTLEAYHGSPFKFDTLSLEHVGTGEGFQKQGWGLYFSQSPEVGEYYKNLVPGKKGHLYRVSLDPTESRYLHWNKPIQEQPQEVQDALKRIIDTEDLPPRPLPEGTASDDMGLQYETEPDVLQYGFDVAKRFSGEDVYDNLAERLGSKEAASKALRAEGLKGIHFLDDVGEGTKNYVVFDPDDVTLRDPTREIQGVKDFTRYLDDTNPGTLRRLEEALGVKRQLIGKKHADAAIRKHPASGWTKDQYQRMVKAFQKYHETGQAPKGLEETFKDFTRFQAQKEILDTGNAAVRYFEDIDAELPAKLKPFEKELKQAKGIVRRLHDEEVALGLKTSRLDDIFADYFPRLRKRFPTSSGKGAGSKQYQTTHGFQQGREEFLKNHPGGTEVINRLSIDSDVSGLAHRKHGEKLTSDEMKSVRDYIRANYWSKLPKDNQRISATDELDDLANWVVNLDPKHADYNVPVFETNFLKPLQARVEQGHRAMAGAEATLELLADTLRQPIDVMPRGSRSVARVLEEAGLTDQAGRNLIELVKDQYPNLTVERLKEVFIPEEIAQDVASYMKGITTPEAVSEFARTIWDPFTNAFKTFVTKTWPAFHMRNAVSAMFRNFAGDALDGESAWDALMIMLGKPTRNAAKIFPGMSEQQAMQKVRELAFAYNVVHPHMGVHNDFLGVSSSSGFSLPGGRSMWRERPFGVSKLDQWNPAKIRGVGADEDIFLGARVGDDIGVAVEGTVRLAPFMNLLKKGWTPAEAAKRVALLQVDYTARAAADPVMRRLMPFWSFTRGNVPFLVEQLAERPGGKLGRTIMTAGRAHGETDMVPEHVSQGVSIPRGELPDGSKRYITNLGLMFEDPLSFAGGIAGGPGDLLRQGFRETASRLNPLIKAPAEWASGQTFFQTAGIGGRPLDEMNPPVGQFLANIRELTTGEKREAGPVLGSQGLEFMIANSPLSRFATTARTATDPRKWETPFAQMLNLGTGMRITDVSPATQDAVLRDLAGQAMKELGADSFNRVYFSEEDRLAMPLADRLQAEQFNRLMALLADRAKERKRRRQ